MPMPSPDSHHQGASPRLVLLHGLLGSAQDWQPLLQALPASLRQLALALNLPGHSPAAGPAVDFAHWPAWLDQQLKTHQVGDFILLGYSLGGRLALHYSATVHAATNDAVITDTATPADQPRLRGLIVESGHPGLAGIDERRLRARQDARWVRRFWREPLTEVLADWYQQPVFAELDAVHRQQLLALRGQQDGRAIARMLAATSLARQPDHRAWLADSALPTLWLSGTRDQKFSALACQLARDCPRLAADPIAHAGHNIHRDAPEAMAARLQDWLRQQPPFSAFF
jgi:2-succinyl-6-hydroxy-2,4-cyclohexadiene-1-carboxylate synthase